MTTSKPILCLDFDGVCHSYTSGWINAWTINDPPVAGLFPFLEDAFRVFRIAIHSSRSESQEGRNAMREWFTAHAIEHFMYRAELNSKLAPREEALRLVMRLEFPIYKPAAKVTLDDRAVTFTGYFPDVALLASFEPWTHEVQK